MNDNNEIMKPGPAWISPLMAENPRKRPVYDVAARGGRRAQPSVTSAAAVLGLRAGGVGRREGRCGGCRRACVSWSCSGWPRMGCSCVDFGRCCSGTTINENSASDSEGRARLRCAAAGLLQRPARRYDQ